MSSQVHSTTSGGSGNVASPTFRAAAQFANDGFYVLPLWWLEDKQCACRAHGFTGQCKPGKHPIGNLVPNAHEDATTDVATVTAWWTLYPLANVGIALDRSGLVDVAPDSIEWFAEFTGRGLPTTMHFASGGGTGHEHWLYRRGDMPAVRIAKRGKYDVLSDGYCVAPPSVHESGLEYRWIDQVPPIEVPQWVCQFVLDYLTERDAFLGLPDEAVTPAGVDVPPILELTVVQTAIWNNQAMPGIDRSNALVSIAKMLCEAGYQDAEGIASILAERDVALGLNKYSHRRDASRRYREIAYRYGKPPLTAKLTGGGSAVPTIGIGTGEPPGAQEATPIGGRGSGSLIRWRNHSETLAMRPPAVDWLIEGVFGRTLITEVVAKVKVGKTTFVLGGLRAGIAGDDDYCGREVRGPFRVAYVTEEGESTFLEAMRRYGLNDLVEANAFYTVFDYETLPGPFSKQIDELIEHATADQVDVVILDTLSIIAGLDEEDHAGKAAAEMHHVRRLAAAGFAVGILRHSRKSGGEVGDAGRGSSAISGYCDILLQLEPYKGDEDTSNLRVLKSRSRLSMTEPLILEFDKERERYAAIGNLQTREERLAEKIKVTLVENKAFDFDRAMSTNQVTIGTRGNRAGIQRELKEMGLRGDLHHAQRGQAEVYWTDEPLTVHLTHQVVPPTGNQSEPPEPQPPMGVEPEPEKEPGGTDIPSPLKGRGRGTTRKEPTPEAVAKREAEKAERELARLEAADAAAPTLPYTAITETYKLPQWLAQLSTASCSLDTETTGLSAKRDRMRTINLSDGATHLVIDAWKITDLSPLQSYLDKVGSVRMHTYLFDLAFLATRGITIDPQKIVDVKTMSMVLESEEAWVDYRLQAIARRHLAEHVDKAEQKRGWDAPDLRHAKLAYAAEDARVTFAAADALEAKLLADPDVDGLSYCLALEQDVQAATWWLASAGVPCDAKRLRQAIAEQEALIDDSLQELNTLAAVGAETNWRSPAQVLPILQERGLELYSTGIDALMETQSDDLVIGALLAYRSAGTCLGLLRKTLSSVAPDGRIYASFNPIGAQTGRTSCSEPNLQQLPHETRAREAIRPTSGKVFVRADYSQLQIVIAAWLSDDANMKRILNSPGGDIHAATAAAVGCSRQQAKAINFGFLFGAGADTFRREQRKNGIILSDEQAKTYRQTFMRTYPGIRKWHRSLGEWNTEAEVIDDTGSGRRRSRIFSNNVKANTPVQMAEAHGFKLALKRLYDDRGAVPGARLVMMVHDELIAECDYAQRHLVAQWMTSHMVSAMQPLVQGVRIDVEPTIVESYSDDDKKHPLA